MLDAWGYEGAWEGESEHVGAARIGVVEVKRRIMGRASVNANGAWGEVVILVAVRPVPFRRIILESVTRVGVIGWVA